MIDSVWGEDGRVERMWAIPVNGDGSMEKAQKSTARAEHIVDLRGVFGDLVTVHLFGVKPTVFEEAARRAEKFRAAS